MSKKKKEKRRRELILWILTVISLLVSILDGIKDLLS